MSSAGKWILGIAVATAGVGFIVLAFSVFMLATAVTASSVDTYDETTGGSSSGRVALIEVTDVLVDSEDVIRQLRKYRDRSSVKAIVLRLESPGGGVVPSHEIYEEVRRTRKLGTPVVASMGSVAASGAYYIACGASRVVANPGTITGSIGVISEFTNFRELLDKIGVQNTTIKSGEFKDLGNPSRPMREHERAFLQKTIDNVYDQFVDVVVRGRGLSEDSVRSLADGRIYTGEQAYDSGLIDTLGTLLTAVTIAGNLGKIQGEPRIVRERESEKLFDLLMGTETRKTIEQMGTRMHNRTPLEYRFNY
ncbi:MAG: signal peptide peptidase SppA [Ignavibacteria bacterium]|nr:MAG: signal peptide peptidase SppA [Ignavibacteria bacterium]